MKTVNEIIFDRKMDTRPEWEDCFYLDTVKEVLKRQENVRERDMVKRVQNAKIKNVGEKGATELLAAVGLFLTQVSDREIRDVEWTRMQRRKNENLF